MGVDKDESRGEGDQGRGVERLGLLAGAGVARRGCKSGMGDQSGGCCFVCLATYVRREYINAWVQ